MWRNPPGGFADGCIDWTPLPLCAANSGHPDLLFQIFGGKGSGQLVPAIGPYGAVLMVLSIAGAASYILAVRRRRVVSRNRGALRDNLWC